MDVSIPVPLEAELPHRVIQLGPGNFSRENEIKIDRVVCASRMEGGTGATGEHSMNAGAAKRIADFDCDGAQCACALAAHIGFPV